MNVHQQKAGNNFRTLKIHCKITESVDSCLLVLGQQPADITNTILVTEICIVFLATLNCGSMVPKHTRLKERFLIRRNRTKRANFRGKPLFQATYKNTTENSIVPVILANFFFFFKLSESAHVFHVLSVRCTDLRHNT